MKHIALVTNNLSRSLMRFFYEHVGNDEVYLINTCRGQTASAQDSGLNMLKLLEKCDCKVS